MPKQRVRTITDVIAQKKGILLFLGKEKLLVSEEAYLDGYFYPGKEIREDEYQKLKKDSRNRKAEEYVKNLLSRYRYTYHDIYKKVEDHFSLPEKEIKEVLSPYVRSGLIDDEAYAVDYAESKAEKGYGPLYIENELKKKGIRKEIRESQEVREKENLAYENLPFLIENENKKKSSSPIGKRKESILAFLIRRGFSVSESRKAIDSFYSSQDAYSQQEEQKKEAQLLKREATKCYNSLSRKENMDARSKRDHLIKSLLRKGFRYEDIESEISGEEYLFHD